MDTLPLTENKIFQSWVVETVPLLTQKRNPLNKLRKSFPKRKTWVVVDAQHPYPPDGPSRNEVHEVIPNITFPDIPVPAQQPCHPNTYLSEQCKSLIQNKKTHDLPKPQSKPCSLTALIKNCSRFRLVHGYDDAPITKEEREFPLAFAIKMHTSPIQAEQLLRVIYRSHNFYCIHVDKKAADWIFKTMERISRCFDNVHVLVRRENVVYASYGVIAAELKCMKASMNAGIKWKYYLNLSGQEFPLRTNFEIVKILKYFNGANDIETFDLPRSQEWRYNVKHRILEDKMYNSQETKTEFQYNLSLSKGSAYGMFTRGFIQFILQDDIVQKFLEWLQDTYSPDETAWATLNTLPWAPGGYSTESRHTFDTHASRAVIWDWDHGVTCHGKHVRSVCVLGSRDLPWLSLRPNIFANKFDIDYDPVAIDCLEQFINFRTKHPTFSQTNWKYFLNMPHVAHYRTKNRTESVETFLQQRKQTWLNRHERDSKR
ncbi:beta-1,3-galactosyl-O-glycosyl-glycoprotein beta-1,6-N-acetylglucosaminyltransferase [Patella vulgata]|uniref:beta-1,3-galactosyl-O-glycosyl-glycoprotein beta-1,6-N-acetylglucosaminyltransferase n=1 Tax=Patella vulgata TaxID=6465 RepID=UPI00217FD4FF|nr:beta-1,3-galactosyl-O-glycosyl-glycoprotein beta-1,6-N-acetylglucosaminyltransferase [Patella vulgata]